MAGPNNTGNQGVLKPTVIPDTSFSLVPLKTGNPVRIMEKPTERVYQGFGEIPVFAGVGLSRSMAVNVGDGDLRIKVDIPARPSDAPTIIKVFVIHKNPLGK